MEMKERRKEEGKVNVPLRMPQDGRELLNGHDGYEAWSDDDAHLVEGTMCHRLWVYWGRLEWVLASKSARMSSQE